MIRVMRIIARVNVGGPAIHVSLLSRRLDPARFQTELVVGTEGEEEGNHLALHGLDVPSLVTVPDLGREIRGAQDLKCLWQVRALMRRFKPHIVHTHAAKAGTIGRLAAWSAGVPVVVHTFHGHVLRGYFSPRVEQVFRAIERGLARRTDHLVAVSPRVRDELLDMGIGTPETFSVIPLGFDLDGFAAAPTLRGELRRELGLRPDTPLVGIVARLVPIKAHEVFFEAAAELSRRVAGVHFVIVGDGERRAELEHLAARVGVLPVSHFLGWRADLARIYADLDVVTLTSRNEGSPVALIEAMACARPVVATRVGGVPDVVEHGATGWLVDMDDVPALAAQVQAALGLEDAGAAIGRAGQARVRERYGADRLVHDIEGLYERLLAHKGVTA